LQIKKGASRPQRDSGISESAGGLEKGGIGQEPRKTNLTHANVPLEKGRQGPVLPDPEKKSPNEEGKQTGKRGREQWPGKEDLVRGATSKKGGEKSRGYIVR